MLELLGAIVAVISDLLLWVCVLTFGAWRTVLSSERRRKLNAELKGSGSIQRGAIIFSLVVRMSLIPLIGYFVGWVLLSGAKTGIRFFV